jgi:hypothetical protein
MEEEEDDNLQEGHMQQNSLNVEELDADVDDDDEDEEDGPGPLGIIKCRCLSNM